MSRRPARAGRCIFCGRRKTSRGRLPIEVANAWRHPSATYKGHPIVRAGGGYVGTAYAVHATEAWIEDRTGVIHLTRLPDRYQDVGDAYEGEVCEGGVVE